MGRWVPHDERPAAAVPVFHWVTLLVFLLATVVWHAGTPPGAPPARDLPPVWSPALLDVAALGDRPLAARLLMLGIQAWDQQPGRSVAFRDLDYGRLAGWLGRVLDLDPLLGYPLLAAARVYAEVADPARQRRMVEFVRRRASEDPGRRWPWLAHAVFVARHRLGDLPLALDLARELAAGAPAEAPAWVRQMHIFVLEDMGETQAARVLLGALLESGQVTDPHEWRFLHGRLEAMEGGGAADPSPR